MTQPETEPQVTQKDQEAAEAWKFIECKHCSEYEGDFVSDLAAAFAAHRLSAIRDLTK